MVNKLAQQLTHGNTEFAHRVRRHYGLMAFIAREADVTRAHVTRVLFGSSTSRRVMRIAIRELMKAEKVGMFERAA